MRRVLAVSVALFASCAFAALADDAVDKAPVFPNFAFTSIDGTQQLDIESFRGRPMLMTFWASWCGPCRQELPELQKLTDELADTGFALVTINMDDFAINGVRFLKKYDIDVPVYRMDQKSLMTIGVQSLPTNLLLDPDGRPVMILRGYSPAVPEEIRRLVSEMELSEGTDERSGP